jgi:hypothetical protein
MALGWPWVALPHARSGTPEDGFHGGRSPLQGPPRGKQTVEIESSLVEEKGQTKSSEQIAQRRSLTVALLCSLN